MFEVPNFFHSLLTFWDDHHVNQTMIRNKEEFSFELIRLFVYIFQAKPIRMPKLVILHVKWQIMYLLPEVANIYGFWLANWKCKQICWLV